MPRVLGIASRRRVSGFQAPKEHKSTLRTSITEAPMADHWRLGLPILIAAVALSPLGARMTPYVNKGLLLSLFAAFLLFAGGMMLFYQPRQREQTLDSARLWRRLAPKGRCQMLSNREQRGPPWGVAEQPRPDAEQRGRSPTILLLGGADQLASVLPLRGIFLVEQTKWAWSASRSDRPDLSPGKSRFNRFAWNGS